MKAYGPKLYKKQKNAGVIAEADFKFMYERPNGDPDFDLEHNRKVIADTIRKTKANEARLHKEYMNKVEERVDATVSLLKAMERRKFNSETDNAEAFALSHFAKEELARLRGQQIREELLGRLVMNKN